MAHTFNFYRHLRKYNKEFSMRKKPSDILIKRHKKKKPVYSTNLISKFH